MDFTVGQCYCIKRFSTIELVSVLMPDCADKVVAQSLSIYVNFDDYHVYANNKHEMTIEGNWIEIDSTLYHNAWDDITPKLRQTVDYYSDFDIHEPIVNNEQHVSDVKYPKGCCYQRVDGLDIEFFKLKNSYATGCGTVKNIHIQTASNQYGIFVSDERYLRINDTDKIIDRKDFTKMWKYQNVEFSQFIKAYHRKFDELYQLMSSIEK